MVSMQDKQIVESDQDILNKILVNSIVLLYYVNIICSS